ncbi:MAG: 2-C-methyl-D-erythritol 4-phosphate cytidylyltransferase [Burkholderiales bacterium]|nr:2-C-methyl-D-erythritol 4-phosphate cytidylyltransferase [Burkholderiales bacterium]
MYKTIVLISCAGNGSRFGSDIPKQYTKIGAKTVLLHTLEVFIGMSEINQIIIVVNPNDQYISDYADISPKITIAKVGGVRRIDSVLNGLKQLKCLDNDWILVHDAVRCCITPFLVRNLINQLINDPVGGILAVPVTDTVKLGNNGRIINTIERNQVYLAQTPQMFRYGVLLAALTNPGLDHITDDASCVEQLGKIVHLVEGSYQNIKITHPHDIKLAKLFLEV